MSKELHWFEAVGGGGLQLVKKALLYQAATQATAMVKEFK